MDISIEDLLERVEALEELTWERRMIRMCRHCINAHAVAHAHKPYPGPKRLPIPPVPYWKEYKEEA